jgi:hypothetical protein
MISLLLLSVTSKALAGKALPRTPHPHPPGIDIVRVISKRASFALTTRQRSGYLNRPADMPNIAPDDIYIHCPAETLGVCRARQSAVRHHSTPPDHEEKSIIATIANPIIQTSAPVEASIPLLGLENKNILLQLLQDR